MTELKRRAAQYAAMPIHTDTTKPSSFSKSLLGFIFLGGLFFTAVVKAETFTTAFGFDIELPEQWLMLTRQTLTEDYAGEDMNSLGLAGSFASPEAASQTLQGILEGRYQYFFYKPQGATDFVDYISLRFEPSGDTDNLVT